jgi:hypothetical protein
MEIEEQVLSIEQVRELQELGFDFRKYSSACVIEAKDRNKYIVDRRLIGLHIGFMETEVIEYHETMTIGDIINILPVKIEEDYSVKIEEDYFLSVNLEYCGYSMVGGIDTIFLISEKEFINNLFKTLVWCIKQKHIKL